MSNPIQRTFAGGEISPATQARVDTTKYQTALETMRNTIVMGEGGAANRPGWEYIGTIPSSTTKNRLVEFEFNDDDTYILEFGHQYIRVIKNGEYVTVSSVAISAITKANPGVVTSNAHGISNGRIVQLQFIDGMTELNSQFFVVANSTANTFTLKDFNGNDIDTTSYGVFVPGFALAAIVFSLTTVYDEDDLSEIQVAQSADVLTIVHKDYPPYELSRIADYNWTISTSDFKRYSSYLPLAITSTAAAPGAFDQYYKVTGYNRDTGIESLPGTVAAVGVTSITKANPGVVTTASAYAENGLEIVLNVSGMTELNGRRFIARNISGNSFELYDFKGNPLDTTSFGTFGVGNCFKTFTKVASTLPINNTTNYVTLTWTAPTAFTEFYIYKYYLTGWYKVGTIAGGAWKDLGVTPDISDPAPDYDEPFLRSGEYPRSVAYIQQSLVLASTGDEPEKLLKSEIGNYHNFTPRFPVQSNDPTIFTMAGNKVNQIRHVIDLAKMIIFTSSGEWTAEGADGVVTPTSINLKQYSRYGSSKVRPLVVDGNALFIQARGSIIRDLSFEWETQGYKGNDLTKFARHLFKGFTVVDWAYQQNPDSIIWAVRSDGKLLGLTYVREHQIWGWHHHDTDGFVENVAVVTEGEYDSLYAVIRRTIDGVATRNVERLSSRYFSHIRDAKFMDSFVTYDGRNTNVPYTLTLTGSGWTPTDTLTLTCPGSLFTSGDIGNEIHFTDADGEVIVKFEITGYTSGTVVTGKPLSNVPVSLQAVATSSWSRAVDQITGLHHLEGKAVSIFGDGFVVASPNNDKYVVRTVSGGSVSFDECFAVIHVGLPYVSDLVTLEIDTTQGTYSSQKKITSQLDVRVHESRGIWMGQALPDDESTEGMYEYKQKYLEDGVIPPLISEVIEQKISGKWTKPGRIAIRQVDPLPLQILSVSPSVMIEEGKG